MISPTVLIVSFSGAMATLSTTAILAQLAGSENNVVSSIAAWGPAGASIVVTVYFLKYLADDHQRHIDAIKKVSDDNSKAQESLRAELERMGDRFDHSQELFQQQFQRISENQTKILQETISVVGSLQGTVSEMKRSIGEMHVMLVKFLPGPEIHVKPSSAIESGVTRP